MRRCDQVGEVGRVPALSIRFIIGAAVAEMKVDQVLQLKKSTEVRAADIGADRNGIQAMTT